MRAAGFVLVGGRSSRMGQDKALLQGRSGLLVEEVAEQVRAAAGSVVLIGDPQRYRHLNYECLPDRRPGMGPLAGIEGALLSGRGDRNLIVACDMPGLQSAWLHRLLMESAETESPCTVLLDGKGVIQPLCAVYRSGCLPAIQKAICERRLKLLDVVDELSPRTVAISHPVSNVNTPEEWAAWQEAEAR
jgi:molybdopterin-guanine dinucleotide biosynthesis protein A